MSVAKNVSEYPGEDEVDTAFGAAWFAVSLETTSRDEAAYSVWTIAPEPLRISG